MEIAVLLLIVGTSFLIGSASTQSLTCSFADISIQQRDHYMCYLSIENPNGLNNFTQIGGVHLPGFNDASVTAVLREYIYSVSQNIPQIICSRFSNVTHMDMSHLRVQNVNQNSFSDCRGLDTLLLFFNEIVELPEDAFRSNPQLEYLDLEYNQLTTLPENIFQNLRNLQHVDFSYNPITSLPSNVFRNLSNLNTIYLRETRLTSINERLFENLWNLTTLELVSSPLTQPIPANAFRDLRNLLYLQIGDCNIREINQQWFRNLSNLNYLVLYRNLLTSLPSNAFNGLDSLLVLDLAGNSLTNIAADAFANLNNLLSISFDNNGLTFLNPQWFANMSLLQSVYFDHNSITKLPDGLFAANHLIFEYAFWMNNIRTINRNAFGSLENVMYMDFEDNSVNAVDERVLLETTTMMSLYFRDNICADDFFFNFPANREDFLLRLETCTRNFRNVIATTTQPSSTYNFFTSPQTGIRLFVSSSTEVHIALSTLNSTSNTMIEIIIGDENNTISSIRNGGTTVARASSPNILSGAGRWTSLRITWWRNVVSVWEGDESFPFMAWMMEQVIPINFFGLRSQNGQASWDVEPVLSLEPY